MPLLDTQVRIRHPCPFCEFSGMFPDVAITLWCSRRWETMYYQVPEPSMLEGVIQASKEYLETKLMFKDDRSAIMTGPCRHDDFPTVLMVADRHGCWMVPPETYRDGWETHRIICADRAALRGFVDEIEREWEIEIISHRPRTTSDVVSQVGVVPVHFFADLTDKQVRSLVAAYEEGLLDVPAKGDMDRLAKRLGISRSTLGEHLRKAQHQIVRNSYDYLRMQISESQRGERPKRGRGD
jgi:predicted DNA binding protein